MHELVWNKSGYQIVQREKDSENAPSPPPPVVATAKLCPVDRPLWKQFVQTGRADLARLKMPIAESWHRCRKMGVDPALGKCWDIRNEKELGLGHMRLREMVAETRQQIYDRVRGRGLLITVSDHQGYLIGMWGDPNVLMGADKLNFGPGANWSEGSVGTNAIGTALTFGHPLQVVGHEHFCESHHGWICSAAPIFDIGGQILGCIDISGPMGSNHHQALALAVRGARAIEGQFYRQQAIDLQQQSTRLITSVFNAVMTGLVYLDLQGTIKATNPTACMLIGHESDQLVGTRAHTYFKLGHVLERLKTNIGSRLQSGLRIDLLRQSNNDVRAHLLTSPNGTPSGYLLVIQERQRPRLSVPTQLPTGSDPFAGIIGDSSAMRSAVETTRRVARTDTTVMITGESGTGKEIMARSLHNASQRAKGPFVAVNCGAIAPDLIQSELFGYVDGAFTGARRGGSPGKFEQASGGTLFLDEIAEMPRTLQVNLLRVLEEGQVTRVGGTKPVLVKVRIVTATNKDLTEQVRLGKFRQDLLYRLKVVCINLPPLRRRGADVAQLADHFIAELSARLGRRLRRVEPEFFRCIDHYSWPGNVRELRHAIEGAIAMMPIDVLAADYLPEPIRRAAARPPTHPTEPATFNLESVQKETIRRAHAHFGGNISRMAAALGIGRNTLYAKLKKYSLS